MLWVESFRLLSGTRKAAPQRLMPAAKQLFWQELGPRSPRRSPNPRFPCSLARLPRPETPGPSSSRTTTTLSSILPGVPATCEGAFALPPGCRTPGSTSGSPSIVPHALSMNASACSQHSKFALARCRGSLEHAGRSAIPPANKAESSSAKQCSVSAAVHSP